MLAHHTAALCQLDEPEDQSRDDSLSVLLSRIASSDLFTYPRHAIVQARRGGMTQSSFTDKIDGKNRRVAEDKEEALRAVCHLRSSH